MVWEGRHREVSPYPDQSQKRHRSSDCPDLSNQQVARELDLNAGDVQAMTEQLRAGILAARPAEILAGVVECDEIYVTAGHKGQPAAVAKKVAQAAGAA